MNSLKQTFNAEKKTGEMLGDSHQPFIVPDVPSWKQHMTKLDAPTSQDLAGCLYFTNGRPTSRGSLSKFGTSQFSSKLSTTAKSKSPWEKLPPESLSSVGLVTPLKAMYTANNDMKNYPDQSAEWPVQLQAKGGRQKDPPPLTLRQSVVFEVDRTKSQIHFEESHNLQCLQEMSESVSDFMNALQVSADPRKETWEPKLHEKTGGPLDIASTWPTPSFTHKDPHEAD